MLGLAHALLRPRQAGLRGAPETKPSAGSLSSQEGALHGSVVTELRTLTILRHKQRRNGDGTYRDYLLCDVACDLTGTTFERLIPLFHTDGPSTDPDYNWGEVCRVFPPTSAAFQYLYGQRNDTEARHTDLKARAKYLPADVPGQELRLLAAAMLSNALAWQVHCQAHEKPNIFDGTA